MIPSSLQGLVEFFKALPSIGDKTALRLAMHLMKQPDAFVEGFAQSMLDSKLNTVCCKTCFTYTNQAICSVCSDPNRDASVICVVQDIKDVVAMSSVQNYKGVYHVLQGLISPMEGIGPNDIRIKELLGRVKDDTEIILALDGSVEAEATTLFLSKVMKPLGVRITRLASGLSAGSTLENADTQSIINALKGRVEVE